MRNEPDLPAALFAIAALLATNKTTPGATKRCRKRMDRALAHMGSAEVLAEADPDLIEGAVAWMRRSCKICGRCEGR